MSGPKCSFVADEQKIQLDYFNRHFADRTGHRGRPFQLRTEHKLDGLLPQIREPARTIFTDLDIQWHPFVGHGRSSQACCVNFLMPFADKPKLLSRWLGHLLDIEPPEVCQVESHEAGDHRYVAFEYTGPGKQDFLGEAEGRVPGRGAHATASDAAVGYIGTDGQRELLLIEWKYSEEYRSHRLSPDVNGKRFARYGNATFAPAGPIRSDLGLQLTDFLREPFYQLMRQQLLAWQIERKSDFDRVRVLHLSPTGNRALHLVTSPAFHTVGGGSYDDAFAAFRASLADPSAFIERSIEETFGCLAGWDEADWYGDLADRYPSLLQATQSRPTKETRA
jgi:hypothetical protein